MKNYNVNCLNIAYIFKASVSSINGSWTEGNVSTIKKITLPNGKQLPYVSGQSLKYQIRRYWQEQGLPLSEQQKAEKSKGVEFTMGNPFNFIDDDLLGYMIASKGENRRRTAVVRISPAIGQFEFQGDRDLGTKSKEGTGKDMSEGGNIFETELSYNYYKVNMLIELDRAGNFTSQEAGNNKVENIAKEERIKRLEYLLDAVKYSWGGGKQSRLLTDMSPKFVALTFQTVKSPIFMESLNISDELELDTDTINEVLKDNKSIISKSIIGLRKGIFNNDVSAGLELSANKPEQSAKIQSVDEAFKQAKEHLKELSW